MGREVKTPDGTVLYNVPENITDEEAVNKYLSASLSVSVEKPEEPPVAEESSEPSYAVDAMRGALKYGSAATKLVADVVNSAGRAFGKDEDIISDKFRRDVTYNVANSIPGINVNELIDNQNKLRPTETIAGMATEVAPYIVGGSAVYGSKLLASLPAIVKGAVSGATIDQLLYTGKEDNIANVLDEAELIEAEGFARDVTDFLATTEDDSPLEERLKILAQGLAIGGAIDTVISTPKLVKKAREMFNKPVTELSSSEQADIFVDYLKEARETTQYQAREPSNLGYSETGKSLQQVATQGSGPIAKFLQQTTTSRGYWTPAAYNAFEDSQYAQRQIVTQAENIANRLQISLRNIGDEATTKEATEQVQRALQDSLGFHPIVTQNDKINYVATNYNLPKETAEEILNARELIDDMSKTLANSSIPNTELKEAILENSGSYIRRSYRLYEDSGYKPSESVKEDAIEYLAQQNLTNIKNITVDEAYERAGNKVQAILNTAKDEAEISDYWSKARKVNTEILKGKKDIPEPIRKLMGEVTEPSENVVLTISKLARLNETNQFFENLYSLGKNKYIFDSVDEASDLVQITGTNSVLNNKFTTPEMLKAIKENESILLSGNAPLVSFLRNFSTLKGASQASKTVYSHVTHLRNFLGGAQFGVANGLNPFGNTAQQAFKTIKNKIAQGGDKELDSLYERYLRLGVINTNVKVNEFRALLETGYESGADNILDNISKKLDGYGLTEKVQRMPGEVYMAVDDFYKIAGFESELKTLKNAFPNESLEVLENKASQIIQDTFPNYDRVPKGIKALRYLPIGNFPSFATEMMRTSANIVKQASVEINSGNKILRNRGLRRLSGFTATMVGAQSIANGTAKLAGFNEEEQKAIQTLSKAPWSDAPKNILVVDGKIYVNDTKSIDSYNAVKTPVLKMYNGIREGQLKGEELEEYLIKSMWDATKTTLAPYIEESILTKAGEDIFTALNSPDGRTAEGKPLFEPGKDKTQMFVDAVEHLYFAFEPGTLTSIMSLAEAAFQKPNPTTGKPKDLKAEIFTNITGVKFTEFSPEDSLMYAVKNYNYEKRLPVSYKPDFVKKPETIKQRYINRENKQYKYQQDLYLKIKAAETLIGKGKTMQILIDNGIPKNQATRLAKGFFSPEEPTLQTITDLFLKTPFENKKDKGPFVAEVFKAYTEMSRTRLIPAEGNKTTKTDEREGFAKGGEVNVPNAPKEPDERIDKMTGLPYNYQAGKAFIDEEDTETRALFSKGSIVAKAAVKSLKKGKEAFEGFKKTLDDFTDGLFEEAELDDVTENLEYVRQDFLYRDPEDFDIPPEEFFDYEIDEYIDLSLKDILSGGPDAPVAPGVKTEEFTRAVNPERLGAMSPDSEDMEVFDNLMTRIDPDYSFYNSIQEQVSGLRSKYSSVTQNLEGLEDLPPEALPMKQFLTKRIGDPSLSEKGKEAIAQAQASTLAKDPELQGLMDKLFKEMPERAEEIKEPLDIDPVKRAEQVKAFVESSAKKEPVYRGISDFNEGEYDIAFTVPREIGAHVGTAGQANTILVKDVDPETMKQQFTVAARGGEKLEPKEVEDFFKGNKDILEERPMPYTISKGYVQIKNPLEIDTDFGTWNAAQLLSNTDPEDFWNDSLGTLLLSARAQGVPDAKINELLDANLDSMVEKANLWNKLDDMKINGQLSELEKRKTDMLQADINLQFRGMLEDMGFDSIKYKNTVESSMVGEDDYSYILFKPNQFKSVNAEKFDINDPRFRKNMGGYIDAAFARNS